MVSDALFPHIRGVIAEAKDPKAAAMRRAKQPMPWWCPTQGITDEAWSEIFLSSSRWVEGPKDFIFREVVTKSGLADATAWGHGPCKKVLPYFQEILMMHPLNLTADEASQMSKHSNRHFLAEVGRAIAIPLEGRQEHGRWKDPGVSNKNASQCMSNRYSPQAAGLRTLQVSDLCLQAIKKLQGQMSIDEFWSFLPTFGGWELLIKSNSPPQINKPIQNASSASSDATSGVTSSTASKKFAHPVPKPGQTVLRHIAVSSRKTVCGRNCSKWAKADADDGLSVCSKCLST